MGSQSERPEPNRTTPLDLEWRSQYHTLIRSLDARMTEPNRTDAEVVARTILILIASGAHPTPAQIVDHVYRVWRPGAGWMGFDSEAWLALVPRVVEVLKSELPSDVHQM